MGTIIGIGIVTLCFLFIGLVMICERWGRHPNSPKWLCKFGFHDYEVISRYEIPRVPGQLIGTILNEEICMKCSHYYNQIPEYLKAIKDREEAKKKRHDLANDLLIVVKQSEEHHQ